VLVDVDQVDVAGDIQLAGAKLAHADDPQGHGLAVGAQQRAMAFVQFLARLLAGAVQRQFGQGGDPLGDGGQVGLLAAVQFHETFHRQLSQHAQGR